MGAPSPVLWDLLTDTAAWPEWGPLIRDVTCSSRRYLTGNATGSVATSVGIALPFTVTHFEEGSSWGWRVAGVAATDHRVEPLENDRCRVSFGVPWPAAPYLGVCRVALARLERMASGRG